MKIPAPIGRMSRDYGERNDITFPNRVVAGGLTWACTRQYSSYYFSTTLSSGQVVKLRFWAVNGFDLAGSSVSVELDGLVVGDGRDTKKIPAGTIRKAVEDLIRVANPMAVKIISAHKDRISAQEAKMKRETAESSKSEAAKRETEKKEALRRANGGR